MRLKLRRKRRIIPYEPPSDYYKFHCKFKGKLIADSVTGKVYKKSEFFELFKVQAIKLLNDEPVENIYLIDRAGWKDGQLIDENLFMPEVVERNYYTKNFYNKHKIYAF
jgi:hypothetical protein